MYFQTYQLILHAQKEKKKRKEKIEMYRTGKEDE